MKLPFAALLALAAAGCHVPPPPDPNDPADAAYIEPKVLMRQLKWASDAANMRIEKGELDETESQKLVSEEAQRLLKAAKLESVPIDQLWEFAEVCRTAKLYAEAEPLFAKAVQYAKETKNEDRRVNDTLRWADVLAHLGKVSEAIATARTTFDAQPKDSAPLVPAILFEIVPAARGKGHDAELAQLLRDAVPLYERTTVNESTQAGQDFLEARPHLAKRAYAVAGELDRSGHN